jgi:5-methylcytosine-specific restriction endonuclease McrA
MRYPAWMTCSLLPYGDTIGVCPVCGTRLTTGQRRWCSTECSRFYTRNHYWPNARAAALNRDGHRCVKCQWSKELFDQLAGGQYFLWSRATLKLCKDDNWLEVNHIVPRAGEGYGMGCHHHQSNLETLCHKCHVKVTRRQRVQRVRLAS